MANAQDITSARIMLRSQEITNPETIEMVPGALHYLARSWNTTAAGFRGLSSADDKWNARADSMVAAAVMLDALALNLTETLDRLADAHAKAAAIPQADASEIQDEEITDKEADRRLIKEIHGRVGRKCATCSETPRQFPSLSVGYDDTGRPACPMHVRADWYEG